ncbi:hypothetical protein [Pseudonocardia dioxanivorans]|uniref:hypothetical protein n=1 Tax=Pseudonocardia dioxanivorans TaxID=240495 RepID=UPI00131A56A9|nr:hypothetical protein [Pseudonocardia dioxanivorans]
MPDYERDWNGPVNRKPKRVGEYDPQDVNEQPLREFYRIARESERDDAQERRSPDQVRR